MTKEEAIWTLENFPVESTGEREAVSMAISALNSGRWIPIEERLPKCGGVYYVARLLDDGFEEQYITDASYFEGKYGSNKWYDDNRINHDRDYLDDVVAWYEAEPYKKGE